MRKLIFLLIVLVWFGWTIFAFIAAETQPDNITPVLLILFAFVFPFIAAAVLKGKGFGIGILISVFYIAFTTVVLSRVAVAYRCSTTAPAPGANLRGCDLSNRELIEIDLSSAILINANLSGTDFTRANFSQADLSGANLSGSTLVEANFTQANLTEANLSDATLIFAVFDEATLDFALLEGATGAGNDQLLSVAASRRGLLFENRDSILRQLSVACQGHPVFLANIIYRENENFHPLIILNNDGSPTSVTHSAPREWWPSRATNAELVACLGTPEENFVETCRYDGNSLIHRTNFNLDIRLVEASSGRTVSQFTLSGTQPDPCPAAVNVRGGGRFEETYAGAPISDAQIIESLVTFVNP